MSRTELAFVVGVVGTAVSFVLVVPQIIRLWRTGQTAGISVTWAAVGVALNIGWLAYVVAQSLWVPIASIVVAITSYLVTLHLLRRNGVGTFAGLLVGGLTLVACGALQLSAGWTVLGTTLALLNGLQFGPSVIAAWRSYVPAGVSPLTWMLSEAEGLSWGFYGVLEKTGPIVIFGVTEATLASLVLLRLWFARHRIRAELQGAS